MLALLASCTFAAAQSNNNVPGPTDFTRFSGFISQRNIFDPNRVPRNSPSYVRRSNTTRATRSTPQFTLVGTMAYEKGMFAFFNGNNSDLRKVLYQSESNGIAGYTVAEITQAGVRLQSADKKQTVNLKIGEGMRQEGSAWLLAGAAAPVTTASAEGESSPATENSSPDTSAPAASAAEPNDILKKLMQQREQELK